MAEHTSIRVSKNGHATIEEAKHNYYEGDVGEHVSFEKFLLDVIEDNTGVSQ